MFQMASLLFSVCFLFIFSLYHIFFHLPIIFSYFCHKIFYLYGKYIAFYPYYCYTVIHMYHHLERCPSGLWCSSRKAMNRKVPRVQIPLSPSKKDQCICTGLFFMLVLLFAMLGNLLLSIRPRYTPHRNTYPIHRWTTSFVVPFL